MSVASLRQRASAALGRTDRVVVVGGEVGRALAARLATDYRVTLLDTSGARPPAPREGLDVHAVDVTDGSALERVGIDADVAVVVTERDSVNLLAVGLLRAVCGVETVVVGVNDPANRAVFDDLGVAAFCASTLLVEGVADALGGDG
jgi:Trk K+ transport system NAD-binding subunit